MYLFANNFETTIVNAITDAATVITLTDTTLFLDGITVSIPNIVSGLGNVILLTLTNGISTEIVKATARSASNFTIVRAQEGSSAQAWDAGTIVQLRLTAAGVSSFFQSATPGYVPVGENALNLQPNRVAEENIASGYHSVALGYNTKADGIASVAVGNGAAAVGVSVGDASSSTDVSAVAVGPAAAATSYEAIAIGQSAAASGGASSAVGSGAIASGGYSLALGTLAQSVGSSSAALLGIARGASSAALGYQSVVDGAHSSAMNGGYAAPDYAVSTGGFWMLPADKNYDQQEHKTSGTIAAFATPVMDLGVRPVWQASHLYTNGQVIKPTAGGNVQYRLVITPEADLTHLDFTTGGTQPTWPGAGNTVYQAGPPEAIWVGIDLTAGYSTTPFHKWLTFYLTGLKFVCYEFSTLATAPTISLGTTSDSTALIASVGIPVTAAGQIYNIAIPNPCPAITNIGLTIKQLSIPASGQAVGRFIFEGYFVEVLKRV